MTGAPASARREPGRWAPRTLSESRRRHGERLAALFTQGLQPCRQAGLVKPGRVAIDGTKIKANASKHKAMSDGRMQRAAPALRAEVELLRRAEAADREEDERYGERRGDELPTELARRESRLAVLRQAGAALEAEARERARAEGKDPDQARPPDQAQRNFTDPESRIQKTADGFIQGYNGQLAVDGGPAQIIVAQHVTAAAPDVQELGPAVRAIQRVLRCTPRAVLADAGYWSEAYVRALEALGIEPFIAPPSARSTARRHRGRRVGARRPSSGRASGLPASWRPGRDERSTPCARPPREVALWWRSAARHDDAHW